MCSPGCAAVVSTRSVDAVLGEVAVLVCPPRLAPSLGIRDQVARAGAAHLRVQVARLLGGKMVALDPARGDQQVRVPIAGVATGAGPCAFAFAALLLRRVHVELHREALGDEVLLGERAGQLDPVLGRQHPAGRQRQHDLAGDLGVLAALRCLGRVPQHRAVAEPGIGTLGQQHRVVLRGVPVTEVEQLADPLGGDRIAGIVGSRAHGVAAGGAGQIPGTGERDGHGVRGG